MSTAPLAKITTAANFPEHYMLENLAARADGSVLVVASPQRQLWYVPKPSERQQVEPTLLHTFDDGQLAQCLVEARPEIFYVATYGRATLHRFDMRNWTPGSPVSPTKVFDFEPPAGPNGGCLIAPGVMLFSDCVEGLIWRVDLSDDGLHAEAQVWLKHDTMTAGAGKPPVKFSATMEVPFPGINGLRYGPKTNFVYYTTSSQELFMRVAVDPATHEPIGEPEHIADVPSVDDLCLDEDAGVAYLARHPDHIIERVPLESSTSGLGRAIMAGEPFTDKIIGPTSLDWGREPGDYGRVAYVTTDGGTVKLAPDGVLRPARLMRIEFGAQKAAPR
jgi:sugar lactone lactonase YvrE